MLLKVGVAFSSPWEDFLQAARKQTSQLFIEVRDCQYSVRLYHHALSARIEATIF